ncbi:MAG: lysozyme inhibitor LprI family protein [Methylovirgula sp.]
MASAALLAGSALLLASSDAFAGPMMPPGASPEAGFAGIWRFIAAKPAPWAKPHTLTKTDAPLLEFAVEFATGEVKGAPPLACKTAKYSSGVTYRSEAFGGKLASDKDSTLAKTIHLSDPQLTTFRVYCSTDGDKNIGSEMRDFYVDDHADLATAIGDVIYTLERPTGMDPSQYKVGYIGPSFDCTKAASTAERLICGDAALSQSDRKLGDAYAVLKKSLSTESFATFQSAQRAWLIYVTASCGANVPMPEALGDRTPITDCLNTEFSDRAALLTDLKAEKAGPMMLEPRIRFHTRAKPPIEDSDIYPWMSGGAQAAAFNSFVAKRLKLGTLKLGTWRMDDKSLFTFGEDLGSMHLHARRFYSVARFDSRIVSLQISTSDFTGGNHELLGSTALTWSLAKNRLLSLEDFFGANTVWQAFVTAFCKDALTKQLEEREAPPPDDSVIATTIAESRNWLWGTDKATIIFLIDTISGMPGGEFDVEISLKALKPYLAQAAPIN